MQTDNIKLAKGVIQKVMDRAIEINNEYKVQCRDFQIMVSSKRKDTLILRWTTIDISNEDNPVQCYRYECFNMDGTSQRCSIHYANQEEANDFIWSLKPLHQQQYAIDHKL